MSFRDGLLRFGSNFGFGEGLVVFDCLAFGGGERLGVVQEFIYERGSRCCV